MKKKIVLFILVLFWMGLIFFFSHQKSVQSDNLSNGLIDKIINVVEYFKGSDFTDNQIELIYKYAVFPIRKLAHFMIYLILGILIYNLLKQYRISNILIVSILICLIYALTDEIHQLFVFGRSGELKDVLIDIIGSSVGIFINYHIINKKLKNKKL